MLRILLICVLVATIGCSAAKAEAVDEEFRRCVTVLAVIAAQHDHELHDFHSGGYDTVDLPRLPKYPATPYGGRETLSELVVHHCFLYIDPELLDSLSDDPMG